MIAQASPIQTRPIYENERGFAPPPWFRAALARAIRAGRFGSGFDCERSFVGTVYKAGEVVGLSLDHLGRAGNYLTSEPYHIDEPAIRRFAELLEISVELFGPEQSHWNPDRGGSFEGFAPTYLIVFAERAFKGAID